MSGLEDKKNKEEIENKAPLSFFSSRAFKVFIVVIILGSFVLNIHTAFTSSNLDMLRSLVVFGYGLAALWFILFMLVDAANDRLHNNMLGMLKAHGHFLETVFDVIEDAVTAAEAEVKKRDKGTAANSAKVVKPVAKTDAPKKAPTKKRTAKKSSQKNVISDIKS